MPPPDLSNRKQSLRAAMRQVLVSVPPAAWAGWSRAAARRVVTLPRFASSRVVMLYFPMQSELNPEDVAAAAWASGKIVCLPRADWNAGSMQPVRINEWGPGLDSPVRGVRQPGEGGEVVDPGLIDFVLVPGLAFDASGGRLGRGGGFYDRFLVGVRAFRVGAGLDEQVVDAVPMGPHDARLDAVVTPTRTLVRPQGDGV